MRDVDIYIVNWKLMCLSAWNVFVWQIKPSQPSSRLARDSMNEWKTLNVHISNWTHTVHSRWGSLSLSLSINRNIYMNRFQNHLIIKWQRSAVYKWSTNETPNATNQFIEQFSTSVYIVHIEMGVSHTFLMVAFCRSLKLTDKSKKTIIVDFISLSVWLRWIISCYRNSINMSNWRVNSFLFIFPSIGSGITLENVLIK